MQTKCVPNPHIMAASLLRMMPQGLATDSYSRQLARNDPSRARPGSIYIIAVSLLRMIPQGLAPEPHIIAANLHRMIPQGLAPDAESLQLLRMIPQGLAP